VTLIETPATPPHDGTGPEDLTDLLAAGERSVFHGPPGTAVAPLERAVALAADGGRLPEAAAATWLLGVALGASGRYGRALAVLTPLLGQGSAPGAGPEGRLFGSLAASTSASVSRQLGRHAEARRSDEQALGLADGVGEAAFDATLGLAADAVGLGEPAEAAARLEQAGALVVGDGEEWWRQRVRLSWVQAEVALLTDRPADAVVAAESAVARAERSRAPRHVAKGSLFLGVARLQVGDAATAAATLRRAATLAEGLGALPLVWPSRAVLGALLAETDSPASAASLTAARAAVHEIASDLPPAVRADWLAKPDVAALLAG
jgi:hypothetical protein